MIIITFGIGFFTGFLSGMAGLIWYLNLINPELFDEVVK